MEEELLYYLAFVALPFLAAVIFLAAKRGRAAGGRAPADQLRPDQRD